MGLPSLNRPGEPTLFWCGAAFVSTLLLGLYLIYILVMWGPALRSGAPIPLTPRGEPVGADFANFYLASRLTLSAAGAAVYDPARFDSYRASVLPLHQRQVFPWVYPPVFLLLMLPLALLSYSTALAVWLAGSLSLFLLAMRRLAPHPFTLLLTLGFPATFLNFVPAQNGFLTAALLGWGLHCLDRSPFLGGLLLGLLVYKPHLGVLVPAALLAGGHGRALLGAAVSAGVLSLASLVALGSETWRAFFAALPLSYHLLETGIIPWQGIPSVLAAARLTGAGQTLARSLQYVVMAAVVLAVVWPWRRRSPAYLRYSALVLATLLFSPYLFFYDYVCLALPLAWLGWEGFQQGFGRGEQALLAVGWLSPVFLMPLQGAVLPTVLCPLIVMVLLVTVIYRTCLEESPGRKAAGEP